MNDTTSIERFYVLSNLSTVQYSIAQAVTPPAVMRTRRQFFLFFSATSLSA